MKLPAQLSPVAVTNRTTNPSLWVSQPVFEKVIAGGPYGGRPGRISYQGCSYWSSSSVQVSRQFPRSHDDSLPLGGGEDGDVEPVPGHAGKPFLPEGIQVDLNRHAGRPFADRQGRSVVRVRPERGADEAFIILMSRSRWDS